ncbi:Metal-pseudopaline receptor CntO [Campylobacter majalis]|uniref:Metal-pseudopaline receptor CntO n=1 Tax=Campylobacter majalis TaxID=2790656 RepID=A0ABM8Q7V5_9BACT|nr:TonB-dependent receptor [Campylobacter majalis]CAD7288976.1 Metal-pseudopaline receptor CntO [Campylobacter majalis]
MKKDYWREFGDYENYLFAPSISYRGDDYGINFAYTHTKSLSPIDRGCYIYPVSGEFLPVSAKIRLDEPYNRLKVDVDTIDVNFEKNIAESWLLRGGYGFSQSKHEYGHARVQTYNPNTAALNRRAEYFDGFIHRTHAGSLTLNGVFDTGIISHALLLGVDAKDYYRYRPGALQNPSGTINIYNPVYGNLSLPTTRQKTIQHQKLRTFGIYAQDNINLTDELILSLGLRYDYYDQVARNSYENAPTTDQQDGKMTYQLGLLYLIAPEWSIYTNYAQSFNPQMAISGDNIGSIEPEEGESVEFGTKFQNDSITATAAMFNITKKNIARTIQSTYVPVGEARSRGFEFDFNGRVSKGLSLSASYAYTDAKYIKDKGSYAVLVGKALEATPKHQGSVFANYDFTHLGAKGLRVGGGARYFGSWYTYYLGTNKTLANAGITSGHQYKLPYAVVYDMFASYDTKVLGHDTNFSFNIKNLTDKLYYQSSSIGTNAQVIPVQMGYARQFMFNVAVKF